MRICVYGSSTNIGGTEKYLIELVRTLKDEVQFDYLVSYSSGDIPFEKEIESYGGRILREYYSLNDKKIDGYISHKELFERHQEWDGVYVNLQQVNSAYSLLVEAKKRGIKYRIIHAHSSGPTRKLGIKDYLYRLYFLVTTKKTVTHKFACSKNAGKWFFGENGEFDVIYNPVNFKVFNNNLHDRKEIRNSLGYADDDVVVGYLGRLSYEKNPLFLIDIFNKFKKDNYKLLIVGDGILRDKLEDKIMRENISKKVTMVGEVVDTVDYYRAMDCFIVPSISEGFGIVLLEAQAAGLNIYASYGVVPSETNISGNIRFLSLDDGPTKWAKEIEKNGFKKYNCIDQLEESDYGIKAFRKRMKAIFNIA